MALLDRFLADLKANVPIQKRDVKANKHTMNRIASLPAEVKNKWVKDYLDTYNVVISNKGREVADELATRIAWCKVPQQYKQAAIEVTDDQEASNDPFHAELRTADWDVTVRNVAVEKDSFSDERGHGPEAKALTGTVRFIAGVTTPNAEAFWADADLHTLMPLFKSEAANQISDEEYQAADIDLVEVPNSRKATTGKDGHVTVSVEFDLHDEKNV